MPGGQEFPYLWQHMATHESTQTGHAVLLSVRNHCFTHPIPTLFAMVLHFLWNLTIKMSPSFFDLFPYDRPCIVWSICQIYFFMNLPKYEGRNFSSQECLLKYHLNLQRPCEAAIWTLITLCWRKWNPETGIFLYKIIYIEVIGPKPRLWTHNQTHFHCTVCT